MIGPPGSGKTMLARRLPGIMPPLTQEEALEVTAIHSIAGLLPKAIADVRARPFRSPHHTLSEVGMVGGGDGLRPGEVSLAHHGALFLDELAEFRRPALEALRQPLEDGTVSISRAHGKITFPARPLVVAATNPCACGYLGDGSDRCACTRDRIQKYRARLSGPLLDRLDVHVVLPPVRVGELQADVRGESSAAVAIRVAEARALQRARFEARETSAPTNGALAMRDLESIAALCDRGSRLLATRGRPSRPLRPRLRKGPARRPHPRRSRRADRRRGAPRRRGHRRARPRPPPHHLARRLIRPSGPLTATNKSRSGARLAARDPSVHQAKKVHSIMLSETTAEKMRTLKGVLSSLEKQFGKGRS